MTKHAGNVFQGRAHNVIQAGHISIAGDVVMGTPPPSRKPIVRWVAAGIVLIVGFVAGSTAKSSPAATAPMPSGNVALVAAGKLTVCTYDRPARVGIDFDLIDLVAKRLGVTTQVVTTEIEDGSALNAGRCDLTTGLLILGPRKAAMDFSDSYFRERLGLLVRKDAELRKLDQFTRTNVTLGVQRGARGDGQARERGLAPILFDDEESLFQALLNGRVDAVLHDLITVNERLRSAAVSSGFDRSDEINLDVWYGLAAKKGNAELLKVVNDTFAAAVAEGTWRDVYRKWVLSDPP